MFKAPFVEGRDYDEAIEKIILGIRDRIDEKDDDFIIFCTGTTGTGKSHLSLHGAELYDPEGCDIKYFGLNKKDHAVALNEAAKKKNKRYCVYDEANVSRRSHSSTYNKDLMELYFQIRGLRIFHWWSNPSADILDKPFIQERIKGLVFIYTKSTNRPRSYYYFTKTALLEIWAKEKRLSHDILDKHCEKAMFRGWFKAYQGKLLEPYNNKKEDKMLFAIEKFFNAYGKVDSKEKLFGSIAAGKVLHIAPDTLNKYEYYLHKAGVMNEGEH